MDISEELSDSELFCDAEVDGSVNLISPVENLVLDSKTELQSEENVEHLDVQNNIKNSKNKKKHNNDEKYWDEEDYVNYSQFKGCDKGSNKSRVLNLFNNLSHKFNFDRFEGKIHRHSETSRIRIRDKEDRATHDQVIDFRTVQILYRLVNQKRLMTINGCLSTGKEANVYCGDTETGERVAIKIFKTSILDFKDRSEYVIGDFRFRHTGGRTRANNHKMVGMWAEKEFKNLNKMYNNGVRIPKPLLFREKVILMEYIGDENGGAPLLKNVKFSQSQACEIYRDVIVNMWKMYRKSKLVHADLSEFNMLFFNNRVYIIDVSQAVDQDHPRALDFLRKDCFNVNKYFEKQNVAVLYLDELTNLLMDTAVTEENLDTCLDKLSERAANRDSTLTAEEEVNQEVFKNSFIPKCLDDVNNAERDINKVKSGETSELLYKTLIGFKSDMTGVRKVPEILEHQTSDSEEDDSEKTDDEESSNEDTQQTKFKHSGRPKHETGEEKKLRKQQVKDAKSEKRKTKIKKHVKKRAVKQSRTK